MDPDDLINDDIPCMADEDSESDLFLSDAEADGDALASAGFGTDEDYGCYGNED